MDEAAVVVRGNADVVVSALPRPLFACPVFTKPSSERLPLPSVARPRRLTLRWTSALG